MEALGKMDVRTKGHMSERTITVGSMEWEQEESYSIKHTI